MRNRILCLILFPILLTASFAKADTTKEFVITQKRAGLAADDLTAVFNNGGLVLQSAIIKDQNGMEVGRFKTSRVNPAGSMTAIYTDPVDNMGNPISVFQNYTVTLTVQSKGTGATMKGFNWAKGASSYSMGNTNFQNSVGLLSPDIDLTQDPGTGTAWVSIGDAGGDDFVFLSNIEVWTGLTAAQGDSFDANGNFLTSLLPATPNFTLSSLDLAPGNPEAPQIPIGMYPDDDSYVVALYDVEVGPDSNIADATNLGELAFSTNQPVLTPEPPSFLLLVSGVVLWVIGRQGLQRCRSAV
jgi:hypothetical protein